MKAMNLFKHLLPSLQEGAVGRLLLLLCLIVAGVQSAQADYVSIRKWLNKHADVVNVSIGGVTYEVCHVYWKVGYVDQSYLADGYKERNITDDDSGLLWQTNYYSETNNAYYASVVAITGSGEIVIQDSINNGGRKYPVKYIGRHTEQTLVEKDTTYWVKGIIGGSNQTTTCKYYGYTKTPVSITNTNVTKLTVNGNVEFLGNFSLTSCRSVEFNKDVTFSTNVYFNYATSIVFNDYVTISQAGMLSCNNATTLKFNGLTHEGKIQCNKLTDIYYQNNLPPYSGSFSNYFTNVSASQITAHVANKTSAECQTIHSSWAVYASFGNVVPYTAENPKHTVHVTFENARAQITYTKNGNTFTSTYETSQNITVDGSSDLVIRPYKNYNNLGLASVKLNGAEIIYDLTGSGTMYDAYTISGINSDVYLTFAGVEIVKVNLTVEASAPRNHFITNNFWVRPNYGETDNLFVNQSASFTVSKHGRFFFEMDSQEDPIWGIIWNPIAVYVNGKDRTEDIVYDMSTYFELENLTSDTEIRVVFGPNCDFVRVMSLGPDLLWTGFDGGLNLIDCAEGDNYYVPVAKNGEGVIIRTDLINQDPADLDVIYWKNNGRYSLGQASMDRGGVELTADGKNFQFKLLPNVKDQDRIIGIYPKAPAEPEGFLQTVMRSGGGKSHVQFEYELDCSEPSEIINDGDCKKIYIPPYGSDCETYIDIQISLKDGETFKVYRNGQEVTGMFEKGNYYASEKYTYYYLYKTTELRETATWSIIVEPVNTLQKIIRHGGSSTIAYEYEYEWSAYPYPEEPVTESSPAEFILPPYNDEHGETYFSIWICLLDGETFRVYRNGDEVTDLFTKGNYNESGKYTHYSITLGNSMRDAATWNFVVEPATIDYTFIGNFNNVYATADYGGVIDEPLDGWETAESEITVEGYYKGTIIENPIYKDADAAVLFNTTNNESFRVFRNGVEVTDQFDPFMSAGARIGWIMHNKGAMMHEPAEWVIITESELERYDVNRDGEINISDVTKLVNEILGKEQNDN